MNVCIIPARGGSKRLPRKNAMSIHGIPNIQRVAKIAADTGLFSRIEVSTDDREIGELAKGYATIDWRPPELCEDHVTDIEVIRYYAKRHNDADYICYLYPTAVLVTVDQIRRGYALIAHAKAKRLRCVHLVRRPVWYAHGKYWTDHYHDCGHFYWFTASEIDEPDVTVSGATLGDVEMLIDIMDCQDVNISEDMELARLKLEWRGEV